MVKRFAVLVCVVLAVFLFSAGTILAQEEVIKIGGLLNTSGGAAHIGQTTLRGAQLAVKEINAAGGILIGTKKYKVQLVNYDDKCSAKDSLSAAERLINNDKVGAVLGPICSHCCLAIMELMDKRKVPFVAPIAASAQLTKMGSKHVFQIWSTAAVQVETIVQYAVDSLKLKRGVLFTQNNAWGKSGADEFNLRLKARGGEVLGIEFYEQTNRDFYSALTKVKSLNLDFIFFLSQAEDGAMLVKQARELGVKAQLMGTDDMGNEQFFKVAGDAGAGMPCYWSSGPKNQKAVDYEKRYKTEYGQESIAIDKSGYDGLYMITEAMTKAGTALDGAKIRDALSKIDYEGTRQRFTFNERGGAKIVMWIARMEKNQQLKLLFELPIYDNPSAPI